MARVSQPFPLFQCAWHCCSGTLSPLSVFAQELGLNFPVRLENPHVITREQVCMGAFAQATMRSLSTAGVYADQIKVAVLPVGVTGKQLNSSFKTRESPEYLAELGNTIANFARIVRIAPACSSLGVACC